MLIRRLRWVFLFVGLSLLGNASVWAAPWLGEFSMFGRYGTVQGGAGGEMDGSFGRLNSFGYVGGYGRIGWDQEGLNHRLGAMFARSESWFGGILLRAYGEWDGAQLAGYARGQFALGSSLRWRKVDGWVNVYPFAYGKGRTEQDRGRGKLEDGELLFPTEHWDVVRNYTDFGGRLYLWKGLYVGGRGKLLKNPDGDLGFGGDGLFGMHMGLWGPVDGRLEAVTGYDTANGFVIKVRIGVGYILGKRERSVTSLPVVQRVYEASFFSWKPFVRNKNNPNKNNPNKKNPNKKDPHRIKVGTARNYAELLNLLHDPNVKTVVIQGEIPLPEGIMVPYGVGLAGREGSFTTFDGHVVNFTVTDAPSDSGLTMQGNGVTVSLGGNNTLKGLTLKANGNIAVHNVYDKGYHKSGLIDIENMVVEDGVLDLRTGTMLQMLTVRLLNNTYRLTGTKSLMTHAVAADGTVPIAALIQLIGEDGGTVVINDANGQHVEGKLHVGDQLGLLAVAGKVELERDVTMFDDVKVPDGKFLFTLASLGTTDALRKHTLTVLKAGNISGLETLLWASGYTSAALGNAKTGSLGFNVHLGAIQVDKLGSQMLFSRNFLNGNVGSRVDGIISVDNLQVGTWYFDGQSDLVNISGISFAGKLKIEGTVGLTVGGKASQDLGSFLNAEGAHMNDGVTLHLQVTNNKDLHPEGAAYNFHGATIGGESDLFVKGGDKWQSGAFVGKPFGVAGADLSDVTFAKGAKMHIMTPAIGLGKQEVLINLRGADMRNLASLIFEGEEGKDMEVALRLGDVAAGWFLKADDLNTKWGGLVEAKNYSFNLPKDEGGSFVNIAEGSVLSPGTLKIDKTVIFKGGALGHMWAVNAHGLKVRVPFRVRVDLSGMYRMGNQNTHLDVLNFEKAEIDAHLLLDGMGAVLHGNPATGDGGFAEGLIDFRDANISAELDIENWNVHWDGNSSFAGTVKGGMFNFESAKIAGWVRIVGEMTFTKNISAGFGDDLRGFSWVNLKKVNANQVDVPPLSQVDVALSLMAPDGVALDFTDDVTKTPHALVDTSGANVTLLRFVPQPIFVTEGTGSLKFGGPLLLLVDNLTGEKTHLKTVSMEFGDQSPFSGSQVEFSNFVDTGAASPSVRVDSMTVQFTGTTKDPLSIGATYGSALLNFDRASLGNISVHLFHVLSAGSSFASIHGHVARSVTLGGSFETGSSMTDQPLVDLYGAAFEGGEVHLGGLDFSNVTATFNTAGKVVFDMGGVTGNGTISFGKLKLRSVVLNAATTVFNLMDTGLTGTIALPDQAFTINVNSQNVTLLAVSLAKSGLTLTGKLDVEGEDAGPLVVFHGGRGGMLHAGGLRIYVDSLATNLRGALILVDGDTTFYTGSSLPTFYVDLKSPVVFVYPFSFVDVSAYLATQGVFGADFSHIHLQNMKFNPAGPNDVLRLFDFEETAQFLPSGTTVFPNVKIKLPSGDLWLALGSRGALTVLSLPFGLGDFSYRGGSLSLATGEDEGKPSVLKVHGVDTEKGGSLFSFPHLLDKETGSMNPKTSFDASGVQVELYGGNYGTTPGVIFAIGGMNVSGARLDLPKLVGIHDTVKVATGSSAMGVEEASLYNIHKLSLDEGASVHLGNPTNATDEDVGLGWTEGTLQIEGTTARKNYFLVHMDAGGDNSGFLFNIEVGPMDLKALATHVVAVNLPFAALKSEGTTITGRVDWSGAFAKKPPQDGKEYDATWVNALHRKGNISLTVNADSKAPGPSTGKIVAFHLPSGPLEGTILLKEESTKNAWEHYDVFNDGTGNFSSGKLTYQPSSGRGAKLVLDGREKSGFTVEVSTEDLGAKMAADAVRIELHKEFAGTLKFTGSNWNYGAMSANVATDFISTTGINNDLVGKIEVDPNLGITFGSTTPTNFAQWLKGAYPKIKGKVNPTSW